MENCSLMRAISAVGDVWTLGILRCTLFGLRRFGEFEAELGIATNVLANRLADLTELGLLTRAAYQDHPTRYEYTLSPSGRELVPALLLLKAWGDRHLQPDGAWTQLRHRGCAGDAVVDARCADCGAVLAVEDIETVPLRALPA
ncbi:MAG: helix-turn-helix transcriptional regulator [Acidimicrobiales bacterium]|nr:helix-turn-helix transcriptional regulator [Acidimicrobiales bacterium]